MMFKQANDMVNRYIPYNDTPNGILCFVADYEVDYYCIKFIRC